MHATLTLHRQELEALAQQLLREETIERATLLQLLHKTPQARQVMQEPQEPARPLGVETPVLEGAALGAPV